MTDHVAAALDLLGNRTGCEVAKVHALLAIAAAIREQGQNTPQDAPHATHSHTQPDPVPQDQDSEWGAGAWRRDLRTW